MGEDVRRLDDNQKVFAMTYYKKQRFVVEDNSEIEEGLEDAVDVLLGEFVDQFHDDNKLKSTKISEKDEAFASKMGYETNYQEALAKAKKENKDLMLVLETNHCPWCRKFQKNVLEKEEVNSLVQKKYIPLILNRDKDVFPKQFDSPFTPMMYFIDAKSEKSYRKVAGYNNRDEFLAIVRSEKR